MLEQFNPINIKNDGSFPIHKYTIYGERHSGTKFLEQVIKTNFDLTLTWEYGWKHWFGFIDHGLLNQSDCLFICIIRDPYDWLWANQKEPHHKPKNKDLFDIHSEWYSQNPNGTEILGDRNYLTGDRYKDIFELRSLKLRYLRFSLPVLVNNYILISYESLVCNTFKFINYLSASFNLLHNSKGETEPKPLKHYHVPAEYLALFNSKIDWDIENICGYKQVDRTNYRNRT